MVHVAPEPPAPHIHRVAPNRRHLTTESAGDEQRGEIHTGVDRELQRPPQPTIELHKYEMASFPLTLPFDHGDAGPIEVGKERGSRSEQFRIEGNAFAVYTYPAGRRFLAQPPVGEGGNDLPFPAKQEEPFSPAAHATL